MDRRVRKQFALTFFGESKQKLFGDMTTDEDFFQFFKATLQKFNGVPDEKKTRRWMKELRKPVEE